MTKSIRFSNEFIQVAEVHAQANHRSIAGQIEHWAQIGRTAEDNPDLPFEFIQDLLVATAGLKQGKLTQYAHRKRRS